VLARRPKKYWIEAHATWMAWSYVGLSAALVAESLTRFVMPALAESLDHGELWRAFWTVVALASFATVAVGGWLIRMRLAGAIRATPEAMRRARESTRLG